MELTVNGKNLGRKKMPRDGDLSWRATFAPGYVKAVGYKSGKKVLTERIETTGRATQLHAGTSVEKDVTIVNLTLHDSKGRYVPDACDMLTIEAGEGLKILGCGNGDPAFRHKERPLQGEQQMELTAFNGCLQILVKGHGTLNVGGQGGNIRQLNLVIEQ